VFAVHDGLEEVVEPVELGVAADNLVGFPFFEECAVFVEDRWLGLESGHGGII
jgi:hypothetical protein